MGRVRGLAGVALCLALADTVPAAEFSFAALGDTPYTAEEEPAFVGLLAELNRETLAFVVHVGDFKSAIQSCSDALFLQRKGWFELSRHPFVYVPGDNEWTDCRRALGSGYDPLERMRKLREIFFAADSSLGQQPMALLRQHAAARGAHDYPEMNWVRVRVIEENGRVRFEAKPGG